MRIRRWGRRAAGIALIAAAAVEAPITIHLAGDSTMAEKLATKRPETGWGEMLQRHFDPAHVRVMNHARNGRSTRTFIAEGLWQRLVDSVRAGDYVFIQFGHNDGAKSKVDRYTPPSDYRANLVRFVRETRAKGATPVLLTPVIRRRFDERGNVRDSHGVYPDIVREVSREYGVRLIDVHQASARMLGELGVERSRALFLQLAPNAHVNYPTGVEDNTHFSPHGAELLASLVVDEIRAQLRDLAAHLADAPDTGSR